MNIKISTADTPRRPGIGFWERSQPPVNGVFPRRKTLSKAVHVWDLKLDLGHHFFGRESFDREQSKGRPPEPEQPTLWEALDSLTDEDVQISLKRVGKAFGVHLKIKIPA
jgi:hypothetical protein